MIGNKKSTTWWTAQEILNRMRLQALRKRDTPLKEKLAQDEFASGLHAQLVQASTAPSRFLAIAEVTKWLEEQTTPTNSFVLSKIKNLLIPLLQGEDSGALQENPSRPGLAKQPGPASRPGMPQHPGSSSLSAPARPALSRESSPSLPSFQSLPATPAPRKLEGWWQTSAVLDSLRLRLRWSKDSLGQRLFDNQKILSSLEKVLETSALAPSLDKAQNDVLKHLYKEEKTTPWLEAEELWEQLKPLLTLRKDSSPSHPSVPIPSKRLQEIQEEEKDWLERLASEKSQEEAEPDDGLWDWENHNPEMSQFISSAVTHLASGSRSSDDLPAAPGAPSSESVKVKEDK